MEGLPRLFKPGHRSTPLRYHSLSGLALSSGPEPLSLSSSGEQSDQQGDQENCDEDIKQYLSNPCRGAGDASETEDSRNDGNDQKNDSPA